MLPCRAGDRLLALDHRTGRLAFRPLYIFVHREPAVSGVFTNIECAPLGPGGAAGAGNATRRLQLSPRHFLPVCASGEAAACGPPRLGGLADSLRSSAAGWQHRYGGEVAPGMLVLVADGADQVAPAVVLRVWQSVERGLFNPLVEVGSPGPWAGLCWLRQVGRPGQEHSTELVCCQVSVCICGPALWPGACLSYHPLPFLPAPVQGGTLVVDGVLASDQAGAACSLCPALLCPPSPSAAMARCCWQTTHLSDSQQARGPCCTTSHPPLPLPLALLAVRLDPRRLGPRQVASPPAGPVRHHHVPAATAVLAAGA